MLAGINIDIPVGNDKFQDGYERGKSKNIIRPIANVGFAAGTPEPVIAKLREAAKFAIDDATFKAALAKVETPVQYLDQPQFGRFWDADARKLAEVVKKIGKVE